MPGNDWKSYPAGSRERYEAAKKDQSVKVSPFMAGDYTISKAPKAKKKTYGAPWYGDKPAGASPKGNAVKSMIKNKKNK